jgi:hypothetical protein
MPQERLAILRSSKSFRGSQLATSIDVARAGQGLTDRTTDAHAGMPEALPTTPCPTRLRQRVRLLSCKTTALVKRSGEGCSGTLIADTSSETATWSPSTS